MACTGIIKGREVEVEDWDYSTNVLTGLRVEHDPSRPYGRRFEQRGLAINAQETLKRIAVRLHNHQKLVKLVRREQDEVSERRHDRTGNAPLTPQLTTFDGQNTLAHLLCAAYEPSPDAESETEGIPRLCNRTPLPLGHWDLVYYACCAEIRRMYEVLVDTFGPDFEDAKQILHEAGDEGASGSRRPISGVGLAKILEELWQQINDRRLVHALELAVRIRNVEDADKEDPEVPEFDSLNSKQDSREYWETHERSHDGPHDANCHCVATAQGLVDVHPMTPGEIMQMVWDKQADARRKSVRNSEDQTLLGRACNETCNVSPHNMRLLDPTTQPACCCAKECKCRGLCTAAGGECACAGAPLQPGHFRESGSKQSKARDILHEYVNRGPSPPATNFVTDLPDDLAQMYIVDEPRSTNATAQTQMLQRTDSRASSKYVDDLQQAHQQRQRAYTQTSSQRPRATTQNSDLAYVPPPRSIVGTNATSSRADNSAKKDPYPLGLYGDHTGPYPVFATSLQTPRRKPVSQQSPRPYRSEEPTPLSQIVYPSIPCSESNGLFTTGFPEPKAGSLRRAAEAHAAAYARLVQEEYESTRPHSTGSLAESVSTVVDTSSRGGKTPRPPIPTSKTTPAPTTLPRVRGQPVNKTKSKPDLPDFISPRPLSPGKQQRYVSAGGNAKLHERQVIDGPFQPGSSPYGVSGPVVDKEALYKSLEDPEVVRRAFGDASVALTSPGNARRSNEEAVMSPRASESQRDSKVEALKQAEGRERKDSSGSFSAKLKRVFSRKNSEGEGQ